MNVSAHCPARANGGETPASVGDWADASRDASQRDFAISAPAETQRTRLIDAACKAFLMSRGLDPDVDGGQPENGASFNIPCHDPPCDFAWKRVPEIAQP